MKKSKKLTNCTKGQIDKNFEKINKKKLKTQKNFEKMFYQNFEEKKLAHSKHTPSKVRKLQIIHSWRKYEELSKSYRMSRIKYRLLEKIFDKFVEKQILWPFCTGKTYKGPFTKKTKKS